VIVAVGGARYVRVVVDGRGMPDTNLIVLIGHELQHVLEVADAPEVRTADDIDQLFDRIGSSPHCPAGIPNCHETSNARALANQIQRELDAQAQTNSHRNRR
jgi:hypothetical protein